MAFPRKVRVDHSTIHASYDFFSLFHLRGQTDFTLMPMNLMFCITCGLKNLRFNMRGTIKQNLFHNMYYYIRILVSMRTSSSVSTLLP